MGLSRRVAGDISARGQSIAPDNPGSKVLERRSASTDAILSGLFVLNSLRIGGSETKVVRIVNGLVRSGVRMGIACLDASDQLMSALDPAVPVWHLERRGKFSLNAARKLRNLVREHAPRTILAVNLYPTLYVSVALLTNKRRPRTFGLLNTTFFKSDAEWRRSFYGPILRRMDGLVYGCELQRTAWRSQLQSASARSRVIYNGVDTDHFSPLDDAARRLERQRLGIAQDAFVVGTVGRLSEEKNQRVLVDAIAALNDGNSHLMLVGDGSSRKELEAHATQRHVNSRITFAGSQTDVRPALAAMDVFVLPSRTETFSNAALEAMAMCRPVVLSNVGGAGEMVRDGIDGFTLELSALDDALPQLLSRLRHDQELRERVGRAGRDRVIRDFSLRGMIDRYALLLEADPHATTG
jgi:glycosyltransferase involved in cell wall biosynthesis